MDAKIWKNRIIKCCKEVGTYQESFEDSIDTLASLLEKRDEVDSQYQKYGSKPIISHTNKGGATNLVKNPMLVLWDELNKTALTYWRELGLTPSGLKKLDIEIKQEKTGLMEALRSLG